MCIRDSAYDLRCCGNPPLCVAASIIDNTTLLSSGDLAFYGKSKNFNPEEGGEWGWVMGVIIFVLTALWE